METRSASPEVRAKTLPQALVGVMPTLVNPEGAPQHFVKSGSSGLPSSYGRTKVVVLPIDPFHVHAYWEVTEKDRLLAMKRLDPMGAHRLSWVLRFHDVSSDTTRARDEHFDVFVDRAARNWYIELWSPGRRYWVELGTAFGARFSPVSRSREVELPRAEPTPVEPKPVQANSAPRARRAAGIASLSSSEVFEVSAAPPSPPLSAQTPVPAPGGPSASHPFHGEPRRAGPDPERLFSREALGGVSPTGATEPSRSLEVGEPPAPEGSVGPWSSGGLGRKGTSA